MKIAVPREVNLDERRVALVPDVTTRLVKADWTCGWKRVPGSQHVFRTRYTPRLAPAVSPDPAALWGGADVVLKVRAPQARDGSHKAELCRRVPC